MNEYNKRVLRAGINFILEEKIVEIPLHALLTYAKGDMETMQEALLDWQAKGWLKIIKPPDKCSHDDICIHVFQFIDQKSPIPGWLNWK